MTEAIFHVSGPIGGGKSTLGARITELFYSKPVHVVDTDTLISVEEGERFRRQESDSEQSVAQKHAEWERFFHAQLRTTWERARSAGTRVLVFVGTLVHWSPTGEPTTLPLDDEIARQRERYKRAEQVAKFDWGMGGIELPVRLIYLDVPFSQLYEQYVTRELRQVRQHRAIVDALVKKDGARATADFDGLWWMHIASSTEVASDDVEQYNWHLTHNYSALSWKQTLAEISRQIKILVS